MQVSVVVLRPGVLWKCLIEDHRPLLARLRELAPQSELLTLSKGVNGILERAATCEVAELRFVDLVPNGGGHGQGNGTAGRKLYPCWVCGGFSLQCGGGGMCARKQGLA